MQAINLTTKVLLIDNNQAASRQIEVCLSQVKFNSLQLIEVRDRELTTNFIQHHHPDLIFLVVGQHQTNELSSLSLIEKAVEKTVPIILFSTIAKIGLEFIPFEPYDWLSLSEMLPALLEKTIRCSLEKAKLHQELELVQQHNRELNSQLVETKELFQTIVDNSSTLIWMCDRTGQGTFFNQAWSQVIGREPKLKTDISWLQNIHPQDLVYCQNKFNQALASAKGFTISYRLKNRNQEYRWISNHAVPQFAVNGEFEGLAGYCFDITDHKKTEQKLIQRAASDRLLAKITHKIHTSLNLDQILLTTADEVKQFLQAEKIQINRVDEQANLTLLFESRLVGLPLSCDLDESKQLPATMFHNNLTQLTAGNIATKSFSASGLSKAKACSTLLIPIICETKLWGLIHIENCSFDREWTTEETYFLERVAMELSVAIKQTQLYQQLEQANHELEQLSIIDGLTKIANRRKFDQYIKTEWARLAREQTPLSLILCDIDYFKFYNDTYGHQAGDLCLKKVAQALDKIVKRPADLAARYGGEEFVLVLPGTPITGAKYLAQQIRQQIRALKIPHLNSPIDLYLTLSFGVSCCIPHADSNFSILIEAADRGLYQAKAAGRDRAVEYEITPE